MSRISALVNNLNAGEISPRLDARSDLQKYASACRTLENFLVLPQGGVMRRPGTYFAHNLVAPNLTPDGDFATDDNWNVPAGWTIASNKATHTATNNHNLDYLAAILIVGRTYDYTYTISGYSAGTVKFCDEASAHNADGTITGSFVASATAIRFDPSADFAGSVSALEIRERIPVACKLVSFDYATGDTYILAFLHQGIIFFRNAGVILDGSSNVYELPTPYTEDELPELKIVQSADTMYICHENHPPQKLTRTAHAAWTLTAVDSFSKYLTISNVSNDMPTSVVAIVTCNAHGFSDGALVFIDDVAGQVELNGRVYQVELIPTTLNPGGDPNSFKLLTVAGVGVDNTGYTAYTSGGKVWGFPFNGAEKVITAITKANPAKVTCTAHGYATDDYVYITGVQGMVEVNDTAFKITKVDADNFTLGVDSSAYAAYTEQGTVKAGLFVASDEYPTAVTFFEERLIFGGSSKEPQTIWGSVSGDYENFYTDPNEADAAFAFTLLSDKVDSIRWMIGQTYLMIGTAGGVWKMGASSIDEPLTATNVQAKRQVATGVANIDAESLSDSVVFIQRGGLALRSIAYSFEKDKYIAPDLTVLAEHIAKGDSLAESGIIDIDSQQVPFSVLWGVRRDGELLAMTYEPDQQVFGWSRLVTDGQVISVAVESQEDAEDRVWIAVLRTINSVEKCYIEYFMPHEFWNEIEDCFFVDSGLTYDGGAAVAITAITKANPAVVTAAAHGLADGNKVIIWDVEGMTEVNTGIVPAYTVANKTDDTFELSGVDSSAYTAYTGGGYVQAVAQTITGLSHLEGETVQILADGTVHAGAIVASATVTLAYYANKVHIGKGFTSTLKPMRMEPGAQDGASHDKRKRISAITARFYQTLCAKWGINSTTLDTIPFESYTETFTGDIEHSVSGNVSQSADIVIVQDQPLPMTVLAITARLGVMG